MLEVRRDTKTFLLIFISKTASGNKKLVKLTWNDIKYKLSSHRIIFLGFAHVYTRRWAIMQLFEIIISVLISKTHMHRQQIRLT